ncbi:unnamed protein product [Linum trigynum]|uniref:Uncharacterized protein n=1 Tax=Linum trigynum TaxID=586398 RepID=A0AAV2E7G6_9ROSI
MVRFNPALGEDHFISNFISGMEEELRPVVTMWKPLTLANAFQLAQLEEASNEARQKKWRTGASFTLPPSQ